MTPASLAPRRDGAALFCILAIACFLATCAAIAAGVAARAAQAWGSSVQGALTVRVVAPDTPEAASEVAAALAATRGVRAARAVSPARAKALLENWAGPDLALEKLPTLRLVELEIDRARANPAYARALQRALAANGYETEIYAPGPWADEAAEAAARYRAIALTAAAFLTGSALLTAGLAGRARVFADRTLLAPLADMGAPRWRAAAPFAARSALEGFAAGVIGAVVAGLFAAWLTAQALPRLPLPDWRFVLTPGDLLPLAATPLLAGLLAGAGARAAALRLYARAAKIG